MLVGLSPSYFFKDGRFTRLGVIIMPLLTRSYMSYCHVASGADPGFLKGGGVHLRRGYRIFPEGGWRHSQAPPSAPWTLSVWRHPPSEKLKNTLTLGHSQAPPPPLDIARVTSPNPHSPLSPPPPLDPPLHLRSTSNKRGGSNFGPNVKKPTSWPKGGGVRTPWTPPPGSATEPTRTCALLLTFHLFRW